MHSISALTSLVCVPVGILSSAVGIKICAINVAIKNFKSIIKKKKKKHDKIVLLRKDKLNTIQVLLSKALIESYIRHDKFVSVDNVLREYYKMKKKKKILKLLWNTLNKKIETYCLSCKKYTANKNSSIKKPNKID